MAVTSPGTVSPLRIRFGALLVAVVAVALAARIAVAFGLGLSWETPDTRAYLGMAGGILQGAPRSYFPNGYPLLIAVVQAVVGEQALVPALRLLNVLASTAVVGVTGLLGRRIAGEQIGLLAALGTALYPNQLNYARYVLTEPVTTLLLVTGILLFLLPRRVLSGSALYVASLFRSSLAPLLVLLAGMVLLFREPKAGLVRFGLGVLIPALLYGGLVYGGVVRPSDNLGVNSLFAIKSMSHRGIDWEIEETFTPDERAHPMRAYLTFAREHPGEFVAQRLSSLWALWGPLPPLGGEEQSRSLASALLISLRFPLFLLAVVGVVHRRKEEALWVVAAPLLTLTAVHTAFFSSHRHVAPVEPLLILLACLGGAAVVARLRTRRASRLTSSPPSSA